MKNAWPEAAQKTGAKIQRSVKRKWPGKPEADRLTFCKAEGMDLRPLSRAADEYLLRVHRLRSFAAEVGGGGDCFFLAVAQSLQTLRKQVEKLPADVEELFLHGASRTVVAKRLRDIVGRAVIAWAPHRFVDFVTTCLGLEVAGTWLDRWKMSSLLGTTPFAFLKTVNSVEEVLVVESNCLVLHCKHGESTVPVVRTIGKGLDELSALQRVVARHLSEAGNNHWATDLVMSQHPCPGKAEVTEWAQDALHAGLLDTTEEPLHAGVHGCGYDTQHFDYLAFQRMWEAVGQDTEKEMQRAVGEMLSTKGLRCMQLNYYVFRLALRGQHFYSGPKPLAVRSHPRMLEFWWDGIGEWHA